MILTRWRRILWRRFAAIWRISMAPIRSMRADCGSTPRWIWICNEPPTAPCSTAWPPMNDAMVGENHLDNVLAAKVTLASYQHPDWDNEPEINGYVHALVLATAAGHGNSEVRPLHRNCFASRRRLDPAQASRHSEARRHRLCEDSLPRRGWKSACQPGAGLRDARGIAGDRQRHGSDQGDGGWARF